MHSKNNGLLLSTLLAILLISGSASTASADSSAPKDQQADTQNVEPKDGDRVDQQLKIPNSSMERHQQQVMCPVPTGCGPTQCDPCPQK